MGCEQLEVYRRERGTFVDVDPELHDGLFSVHALGQFDHGTDRSLLIDPPSIRNGSQVVDDAEDPDPEDEVPPTVWLNRLRAAVKRDRIEAPELNGLAKDGDACGRRIAEYVLHFEGKKFGASTIHR